MRDILALTLSGFAIGAVMMAIGGRRVYPWQCGDVGLPGRYVPCDEELLFAG